MVKIIPAPKGRGSLNKIERQKEDRELHQCEECGFYYEDREWAEKCEAWCKKNNSCNLEITSHAVTDSQ